MGGRRLRRQWHLQVRVSIEASACHREGGDPLQRPKGVGGSVRRYRRRHDRNQLRRLGGALCRPRGWQHGAISEEGKGGIRPTPSLTSNTCREAQVFREVAEIGEKSWYLFFRDPEVARCHDCFPHRTASRIRVLRVSMWPRWPLRTQVQLDQFLPSVIASSQPWSVTFSFGS